MLTDVDLRKKLKSVGNDKDKKYDNNSKKKLLLHNNNCK
jgi:hypothetical protein